MDEPRREVVLEWRRFPKFTEARDEFRSVPCVYVQATRDGRCIRIGKATRGLEARYRGGTGYALDAAMHDSGNLVFAAEVDATLCGEVEASLIWKHRAALEYNNHGKKKPPGRLLAPRHQGTPPVSFVPS